MEFRLLGPFSAWDGDCELPLGGSRQRALLAVLVLRANELVPTSRLVEELWGERPPPTATKTVQVYVSQLRKVLGAGAVETRAARLRAPRPGRRRRRGPLRARCSTRRGGSSPAARPRRPADAAARRSRSGAASRSRTSATSPLRRREIARLEELRLAAVELRLEAELALGRHAEAVPELEALVRGQPLRENLRGLLMLALYRRAARRTRSPCTRTPGRRSSTSSGSSRARRCSGSRRRSSSRTGARSPRSRRRRRPAASQRPACRRAPARAHADPRFRRVRRAVRRATRAPQDGDRALLRRRRVDRARRAARPGGAAGRARRVFAEARRDGRRHGGRSRSSSATR